MTRVIAVIAIVVLYFWFIKPGLAKEKCATAARKAAVVEIDAKVESNETERQRMQADYEELYFKKCLKEAGR